MEMVFSPAELSSWRLREEAAGQESHGSTAPSPELQLPGHGAQGAAGAALASPTAVATGKARSPPHCPSSMGGTAAAVETGISAHPMPRRELYSHAEASERLDSAASSEVTALLYQ